MIGIIGFVSSHGLNLSRAINCSDLLLGTLFDHNLFHRKSSFHYLSGFDAWTALAIQQFILPSTSFPVCSFSFQRWHWPKDISGKFFWSSMLYSRTDSGFDSIPSYKISNWANTQKTKFIHKKLFLPKKNWKWKTSNTKKKFLGLGGGL